MLNIFKRLPVWLLLAAISVGGLLSHTSVETAEGRTPAQRRLLILGRAPGPILQADIDFSDWSSMFTDAGSTNVTAAADTVYRITNKGALGGYFEQTSASARPTVVTDYAGSLKGVSFDGGDRLISSLSAASWKFLHDGTRRVIMLDMFTPGTIGGYLAMVDNNSASSQAGISLGIGSGPICYTRQGNGSADVFFHQVDSIATSTRYTRTERFEYNISGNDQIRRLNGSQSGAVDSSVAVSSSTPPATLYIGSTASSTISYTGRLRRIRMWTVPAGYSDDWIPAEETSIALP